MITIIKWSIFIWKSEELGLRGLLIGLCIVWLLIRNRVSELIGKLWIICHYLLLRKQKERLEWCSWGLGSRVSWKGLMRLRIRIIFHPRFYNSCSLLQQMELMLPISLPLTSSIEFKLITTALLLILMKLKKNLSLVCIFSPK